VEGGKWRNYDEKREKKHFLKKLLDEGGTSAYKPALADGANAPMALMKTEEEKETQSNRKDCSRSASQ
jgi:hypothetical protein